VIGDRRIKQETAIGGAAVRHETVTDERRPEVGGPTAGTTEAVTVRDLTVAYRDKPVLWDIDLAIPAGTLTAIIGPNGAGKTSLIKAMLGLLPLAAGSVDVFGQPYHRQRRLVAYVPQRGSVDWEFPTSALDVVTMGTYGQLGWVRRPGSAQRSRALHCLDQVGMADFAGRQISQLSGGQQQRVFLARALAQEARVVRHGRAVRGSGRDHRAGDRRPAAGAAGAGQDGRLSPTTTSSRRRTTSDWLVLLNVRLIAAGPFAETFTAENLGRTYGGRLQLLGERYLAVGSR
jgi:manganese/zinc/iron transport system ATP- binding protein